MSTIAQKSENAAHPVYKSGIHSTSSEDVDLDLVSLALLSEAWYSGALTPNCPMIYGDGNSERQRSSTEITHHASEGLSPVHMASKSFHEDLDRDTPSSKCIRERGNIVHPVNGYGIHSTAHVEDDRDLLWPALLSEARHTGALVLNCSDGCGYGGREHSSNEVTQYVYVRDEGWVVAVPGYSSTDAQSSNISPSAPQPLWPPTADPRVTNFCHQTMARVAPPSDMDAISCRRRCPIHFDLTADDSEEECLLVAMQRASRSGATYSATLSRSECRWPSRRRVTCLMGLAEEQHFPTVDPVSPEQPDLLAMGGRVAFLMLWANDIEESGSTPEERRAEYRQLLGEMCMDPEEEMRDIRDGTRQILMYLLEVHMAPPRPRIRRRRRRKR